MATNARGGSAGVPMGTLPMAPSASTPLFNNLGAQLYSPYKAPAGPTQNNQASVEAYAAMMNANAKKPAAAAPKPGPMPAAPPPVSMPVDGPAPVVETKPTQNPASLDGVNAAMGGGAGEGTGYVGALPNGLRPLGRRNYPQDSMALAAVAGGIY